MTLERALRGFAGFFILVSIVLTHYISPKWLWFTAFVGFNLFQSAFTPLEMTDTSDILFLTGFTNWCPMMWVLRKFGVK